MFSKRTVRFAIDWKTILYYRVEHLVSCSHTMLVKIGGRILNVSTTEHLLLLTTLVTAVLVMYSLIFLIVY